MTQNQETGESQPMENPRSQRKSRSRGNKKTTNSKKNANDGATTSTPKTSTDSSPKKKVQENSKPKGKSSKKRNTKRTGNETRATSVYRNELFDPKGPDTAPTFKSVRDPGLFGSSPAFDVVQKDGSIQLKCSFNPSTIHTYRLIHPRYYSWLAFGRIDERVRREEKDMFTNAYANLKDARYVDFYLTLATKLQSYSFSDTRFILLTSTARFESIDYFLAIVTTNESVLDRALIEEMVEAPLNRVYVPYKVLN